MAKSSLRLSNWNYLGGRAIWSLILVVGGLVLLVGWLTKGADQPDASKNQVPGWLQPIIFIAAIGGGGAIGYLVFRRYALWVEFGDQFRYRMLIGGGTRKWANVKSVKLIWEHDQDEQRSYMQVEISLKGGKKIWVAVNEKQAAKVEQFARSRLPELGVQFIDQT